MASSSGYPQEPARIDPEDVAELIKSRNSETASSFVIVDVRDDDYVGGHITGAINISSGMWDLNAGKAAQRLLTEHSSSSGPTTYIFHCMKSQVRGPTCARKFVNQIAFSGVPEGVPPPVVKVLRGGFEGWYMRYKDVEGMVDYS
jgi:rhodanese-related sulfurtransferase